MSDAACSAGEIRRALGVSGTAGLVRLAWRTVFDVTGAPGSVPAVTEPIPDVPVFGAFVTLTKSGELRGCIGSVGREGPADVLVASAARSAATADPRFPPVSAAEVDTLELEISLLTPLEWIDPVALPDAVRPGEHGLLIEKPPYRGLLLPQVATEWGFDAQTFLDETCRKAGLPRAAWRHGARVARFSALVIDGGRAR